MQLHCKCGRFYKKNIPDSLLKCIKQYQMIYSVTILTFFLVLYQKSQLQDLKGKRNLKWKTWATALRAGIFAACYLLQLHPSAWQDYLLCGAINILLFELLINKIALEIDWFYVGKSSRFDKLGKKKWWIMLGFLIATIFIKIKF